ncbi:hypothetical protein [Ralstonia pseudosolanacearum]|uniref:hypothetical protein n=1 Tax=Ralstonia pseudosolanacearum TaxID=1310165 RepID=UPI00267602DF|nr:hypothetical protein [Ralstonia pseudosolanacearum]MDO3560693.1 hypothetical protein [Ralstonia pseudosolanacearum]MDO3570028.1 hypothetical protein [Ralstonia pseudosolanacearum]
MHQLLAASLGHRTYASLRATDLDTLNQKPHYVMFDDAAGLVRATDLGLPVTEAQWREVSMALRPSGITSWLTTMSGKHRAAELVFEDASDHRIHAMKRLAGYDNQWLVGFAD